MHAVLVVIALSDLCLGIRVPVTWNSESAVKDEHELSTSENKPKLPNEYFVYTAKKPQFAVDVAAFHGVHSPEKHYKSYPVRPYTGKERPELGKHKIFNNNNPVFHNFQDYTQQNQPSKSEYSTDVKFEVFHPYEAEKPALNQIYKDPVLTKIRNDIRDSQHRLKTYEEEAGKPNISKDEYLESPQQTDQKIFPHGHVPAPYEIHRPQRRPIYYTHQPIHSNRHHVLNQRFKHPWNINYAKIRPASYYPLRNHISNLRQNHAIKYDDERNQYPQLTPPQAYSEPSDGYDIYEKGRAKYNRLRDNVDESINNAVKQNRPATYQKLELQNNGKENTSDDDEEEFVPVKSYAQVRKSESYKHLPRTAAFDDAASFDEIKNAPRLREAIKSTKAQTVYTEEGYEDAAYDHAGEQKHASENEGHEGYLKEKEISGGNYKTPSFSEKHQDESGNAYQDQILHGEQWQNKDKNKEAESDTEDYSEEDKSIESDIYLDVTTGDRDKRENDSKGSTDKKSEDKDESGETSKENDEKEKEVGRTKRENSPENIKDVLPTKISEGQKFASNFKVPEINFTTTFLNDDELIKIAKIKIDTKKESLKDKYPYYFKDLISIHKHSPLRYAENLKFIPKKSNGGTEFYNSRSNFQCPEVDEEVEVLPEKLNKEGHPDEDEDEATTKKKNFDRIKENPRLKGLGDKIDCFKAKFFGENPLDSPFFKEEIIESPEPVTAPHFPTYKLKSKEKIPADSVIKNVFSTSKNLKNATKSEVEDLIKKLNNGQNQLQGILLRNKDNLKTSLISPNTSSLLQSSPQINIDTDIIDKIKSLVEKPVLQERIDKTSQLISLNKTITLQDINKNGSDHIKNVSQAPPIERKKRAAPFVYEPYKIIREGQIQDSKKSVSNSNISPLIKTLQSSQVVDRETKLLNDQIVKSSAPSRNYKDIGRQDRIKSSPKGTDDNEELTFVDVNTDNRRGEPRYELIPRPRIRNKNYNETENKTVINKPEPFRNKTSSVNSPEKRKLLIHQSRKVLTTAKPYFDISQFIPKPNDLHRPSASNKVNKVVKHVIDEKQHKNGTQSESNASNQDYDKESNEEYEEDYDEEEEISTTKPTRPTSAKTVFKKRVRVSTTTTEYPVTQKVETESPKLRLVTRFRDVSYERLADSKNKEATKNPISKADQVTAPKYREKKRKSSESTLVTDTNTYGGEVDADKEDDMRKKEVDSFIGIKQDMDDYTPLYEKDQKIRNEESPNQEKSDEEYDEDSNESDDDSGENGEDDENDDDDEDEDSEEYEEIDEEVKDKEQNQPTTTPEPTKRTLARTTEPPLSTTEARSAKLELKPVIMRKKIEIHNELPVNKSSPHKVQFKQDIKQIEIIKEGPQKPLRRKPNKNVEVLDLYKDDNLAKEVNKLGDVEIFKQNLDFKTGPKHGGNYRSAKLTKNDENTTPAPRLRLRNSKISKVDVEASQSENTKQIELSDVLSPIEMHGGNLKAQMDVYKSRNAKIASTELDGEPLVDKSKWYNEKTSEKLIEFDESSDEDGPIPRMHGGNFKSINNKSKTRGESKRDKFTELEDSNENDESATRMYGGNLRGTDSRLRSRGGNRNERLIDKQTESENDKVKLKYQMQGGHLKIGRLRNRDNKFNEKLVELEDNSELDEDEPSRMHGGNLEFSKSTNSPDSFEDVKPQLRIRGGNTNAKSDADKTENERYREKLIQAATVDKGKETIERNTAARLLNSFVQAVPILTTTPAYILDPSKRMYYYVDD